MHRAARIYKVWPVPALAQLTDEGEAGHLPDIEMVGGADARDASIRKYLDAGALRVHWQEYDRAGNALYPDDRVVESRAVKEGRTIERRKFRKQVRTGPTDMELPPPDAQTERQIAAHATAIADGVRARLPHNYFQHERVDTESSSTPLSWADRVAAWQERVRDWWRQQWCQHSFYRDENGRCRRCGNQS
jgi:hypothetical protein